MVHHGVKGRRAAEDLASGPIEGAICQARLFDRVVVPVMLGVKELGEEDGDFRFEDFGVVAASFEEEDGDVFVFGEFVGEDAACCAGADDYLRLGVELVGWTGSPIRGLLFLEYESQGHTVVIAV